MKIAAGFLLMVGCLWALFVAWMFLSIVGVTGFAPESWLRMVLYWAGMLVGPVVLVIGAVLLLRGTSVLPGAILAELGCVILTGFALFNSIIGMQRKPLQAPPPYSLYIVFLLIMVFSDAAAYKIYRAIGRRKALRP
jgi:hypothetical protein